MKHSKTQSDPPFHFDETLEKKNASRLHETLKNEPQKRSSLWSEIDGFSKSHLAPK